MKHDCTSNSDTKGTDMRSRQSAALALHQDHSSDEITRPHALIRTGTGASREDLEWLQRRVLVSTIHEYEAKQAMYRGRLGVREWKTAELERDRATAQLLRAMGRG